MLWTFTAARERFGSAVAYIITTVASFAVFVYTLCPTVYAGDSGELSLAASGLGIPHPPGYPVFVLLGRLFTLAGAAEPALMTNVLSALSASLAAGFLCLLLIRLTGSPSLSLAGALILGFSPTFWSQAVVTEVYPLVCLGVMAMLLCMEALDRRGEARYLHLLFYLSGLSLALHQSMILFIPAIIYIAAMKRDALRETGIAGKAFLVALFLLGCSPYFMLFVRSHFDPSISWGGELGWSKFLSFLSRRNYGALQQNAFDLELALANIQGFFLLLVKEFPLVALVFSLFGIAYLNRRKKLFCKVTCIMFFSFLAGMILLINPYPDNVHIYQLSVLYMPAYIIVALWIGAGFCGAIELLLASRIVRMAAFAVDEFRENHVAGKMLWGGDRISAKSIAGRFLGLAILALPVWMGVANFSSNNLGDFFDARAYGENILMTVPEGGTLVVDGDNETFITAYLTKAMNMRPDIKVYHRKGYIFPAPEELKTSSRKHLWKNILKWERKILESNSPVFFSTYCDISRIGDWRLDREGILFRAVKIGSRSRMPGEDGGYIIEEGLGAPKNNRDSKDSPLERTPALLKAYDMEVLGRNPENLDYLVRRFAIGYLQAEWELSESEGEREKANELLSAIERMGYDFAEAHFLVASEMERRGEWRKAYDSYLMSARLDPNASFPWEGLKRVGERIESANTFKPE